MIYIIKEKSDVLIIGSGGAGIRAALELSDRNINVIVVGKCKKRDAHTIMATGGINAALGNMDQNDSWQFHAADTIREGRYINDPLGVKILCKNAPNAIHELAQWKAKFHREKNGKITQRFFGAATYRRACFVGDHTGKEILTILVNQALKRKIIFRNEIYIFSLLHKQGKVNGAIGLHIRTGKLILFHSKIIILATGGHSKMFSRSSSRFWENNGDGIYLAYQCNAIFKDMEMFQFHPTGMLFPPEAEGILVTEAIRGEGGILTNAKGERFMRKYDAKRMELSARDIVARAIFKEIQMGSGTKHNGIWLDVSHKPKKYILKRLPKVYEQFKRYSQIDISKQKMEVAPTAHYSMGGISVNYKTGKTNIPNLFAIGEVTGGLHGANRLGGNSLAEIIVFGRLIGKQCAKDVKKTKWIPLDEKLIEQRKKELIKKCETKKGKDPIQIKKLIQQMMWKYVGVIRNENGLKKALKELEKYKRIHLEGGNSLVRNKKLIAILDIQNMFPTCEMIIQSALTRKESRGAHYRSDYPKISVKWKKSILCIPTKNGFTVSTKKIPHIPKEIKKFLKNKRREHFLE